MVFGLAKYEPLRIDAYNYDYPLWGHIFGWFLSLSSMLCIPVYGVYVWVITDGTTSQVYFIAFANFIRFLLSFFDNFNGHNLLQRFEKLFRPELQIELDASVELELREREE